MITQQRTGGAGLYISGVRVVQPMAGGAAAFSPTSIASLRAWWDMSDATKLFTDAGTTPVSADADLIYQVNDKSGGALHVAQATSGNRPAYKVNIQNGLSVARLDGTAKRWAKASVVLSSLVGTNAATFFAVYKVANNSYSTLIGLDATTSANRIFLSGTWDGNTMFFDHGNVGGGGRISGSTPAAGLGQFAIAAFRRSAGSGAIYVDGGTAAITGTFTDDLDNTQSGTLGVGDATNPVTMDLGEELVFNEALSTTNMNLIGNYLEAKWGVTWNNVS